MNDNEIDTGLAQLQLVGFDVDGVLTDGRFTLDEDGQEFKTFHTQDGYGLRALIKAGVSVAIITGRRSGAVSARMRELDIEHVIQGARDKRRYFTDLCEQLGIDAAHTAFVGDDIPDIECMQAAGLGIAVANAVSAVQSAADWITQRHGGDGAVREICDRIIAARAAR